jgi:hypothetical protein
MVAQNLATATNELVENAVINAVVGSNIDFSLYVESRARFLCVRVTNTTTSQRIARLAIMFDKLKTQGARQVMEEGLRSASRAMGRSPLGLARVMYEASMELDVSTQLDRATVTARHRIP